MAVTTADDCSRVIDKVWHDIHYLSFHKRGALPEMFFSVPIRRDWLGDALEGKLEVAISAINAALEQAEYSTALQNPQVDIKYCRLTLSRPDCIEMACNCFPDVFRDKEKIKNSIQSVLEQMSLLPGVQLIRPVIDAAGSTIGTSSSKQS